MSTSATGLGTLSLQLTKTRFVSRQGESLLYLASILAYAICSALALTVAGGTWMFYNRWQHPFGLTLSPSPKLPAARCPRRRGLFICGFRPSRTPRQSRSG